MFFKGTTAFVLSLLVVTQVSAKELYCHHGSSGGDNGYDSYQEVVISDKPIARHRRIDEADPGYRVRKMAQSATLTLTVGWDNKEVYGNDAVLDYSKTPFAEANYTFAKECMKKIHPTSDKNLQKASLNPKSKRR